MRASDIQKLLIRKHASDLYVPECKNGPTWGTSHLRLDGWALKRTYSPPTTFGYEIKVSRSDFLQDVKWTDYKHCCNYLYMVCPSGLIDPSEIHDDAGLLWVAKTGTRLYTKKKAKRNDETPGMEDLFRYVLMSRVELSNTSYGRDKFSTFKEYLEKKEEYSSVGRRISRLISDGVEARVGDVLTENAKLKTENSTLSEIKKVAMSLGIDKFSDFWSKHKFEDEARKMFADGAVKNFRTSVADVLKKCDEFINSSVKEVADEAEGICPISDED